jgi:glucose/arabinose dehydrogenase
MPTVNPMTRQICRLFSLVLAAGTALPMAEGQLVRQANITLTLPPDLPSATGYATENALGSLTFSLPMCTAFPPGDTNRLFVAQRGGILRVVPNLTAPSASDYFALTSLLSAGQTLRTDGENGFLSLAFHPNFATNRTLFVYFSIDVGGTLYQRLHQVTVSSATATSVTISQHKPLLTILDRDTNHNGGSINFGPDGYLYLSLGDEGGGGDNRNNARFINHFRRTTNPVVHRTGFWGQLLRNAVEVDPVGQPGVFPPNTVDPNPHIQNSTAFPSAVHGNYRVPLDNPFHGYTRWHSQTIDPATVRTEIFATGLRNPFRWSFDPSTGRIFLADVGQDVYEEVDIISKGDDLGWSWREGFHPFTTSQPYPDSSPGNTNAEPPPPQPNDPPGTGFSPRAPIYEYDHTNDGVGNDAVIYGSSITGGIVYRGSRLTELFGRYLFADYNSGRVAALRENNGVWTGQRLISSESGFVHFGYDPRNNDALLCNLNNGTIRRLIRSGVTGTQPPATLAAAGVFSNLADLTPNQGIVPYEPNVPFWSDYAHKTRWFSIKNLTDTVAFNADGNWTFPTGMVWVKNYDIDLERGNPATRRRLETRILVKTATEVYGLSYQWDNIQSGAQTNATLVAEDGLSFPIPGSSPPQTWRFPSRSECKGCHTSVGGFALSFNTRQFNRSYTYGAQTQNQIAALSGAGYFSSPVTGIANLPSLVRADDPTASLEWRVRSHLAVNCSQCHQPGGPATGNWDGRPTTATDAAGIINGILLNTFGDPANRFIVKNDVSHSMVIKRMQGAGVPRMPPIATNERDLVAEQLVTHWIEDVLPSRQSFAEWQLANFGSMSTPEAQPNADPDSDGDKNSIEFLRGTAPNQFGPPFLSTLSTSASGGNFILQFQQPANRSVLVETTTDFQSWSLWNVPGNAPSYPPAAINRTLIGPIDTPNRYFRLKLGDL